MIWQLEVNTLFDDMTVSVNTLFDDWQVNTLFDDMTAWS